jgi:chromosomal replication initiation ATPase DnaA
MEGCQSQPIWGQAKTLELQNMTQLPLDMPFRAVIGRDDFIVSDCNALAAASIEQWPDWPGGCRALNIVGPTGAGKSHLAAIWQAEVGVAQTLNTLAADEKPPEPSFYVLDRFDSGLQWDEESLFHLFNRCSNQGGLLILSEKPVGQMNWQLVDLRSRMRAVNLVQIDVPDDTLLHALFDKFFMERQIVAPTAMLDYLVGRMERSYTAVQKIATTLDHRSIAEKRPLSVALARDVLQSFIS